MLVADDNKTVRHTNSAVAKKGVRHGAGVRVIFADHRAAASLISVLVWNRQNEVLQLNHNQSLDQIAVDGISHPCVTGFDLQTAAPLRVEHVDLILKIQDAVLRRRTQSLYLRSVRLAEFDRKSECRQVWPSSASTTSLVSPFCNVIVQINGSCA